MRSVILLAIGFGILLGLPSQLLHAQSDSRVARLSSAAYGPDSPKQENRLFRFQTSRYGFAYNCDDEEAKRNHPAICWQAADGEVLPKRMGCLQRVRHEVAQVSRRILDGMCDSGCSNCQQQRKPTCACAKCVAEEGVTESTVVAESPVVEEVEQASVAAEPMVAETVPTTSLDSATSFPPATSLAQAISSAPATGRRSGLIRLTRLDSSVAETVVETVQADEEMFSSDQHVDSPPIEHIDSSPIEYVKPPVARITSAATDPTVTGAGLGTTDSQRLGLLDRLKIIRSLQASDTTKVKKF